MHSVYAPLLYRPPPPSHSARYNITSTTCMYIHILPPPSPQHNYVTMHAFSICATALGKDHQHLHHTAQITLLCPTTTTTATATTMTTTAQITSIDSVYVPLLQEKDHHHHHQTVQVTILHPTTTTTAPVTMHAFSICSTGLGRRPPPPPSHSASCNITATTTIPHMTTTTYNHHHHIKVQPPPPRSASCIGCLFVCVHISKCASAPRKNTTSASCSR